MVRHVYESTVLLSQLAETKLFPEVSGFPVVYGFFPGEPISTKSGITGITPYFALGGLAMQCLALRWKCILMQKQVSLFEETLMCGHLQRERCSLKVATQFNIQRRVASIWGAES